MAMRIKTMHAVACCLSLLAAACSPGVVHRTEKRYLPQAYTGSRVDSVNSARIHWREFFHDSSLVALIDTALRNNQEYNIVLQEIEVARNESRARKGEYLPFVNASLGAGLDKVGEYTRLGAVEASGEIAPGKSFPDPLTDLTIAANISWEVDVWKRLRNAKKSAVHRYLATIEGKNFMVTRLIGEVAQAYYELLALDSQLEILQQNIGVQQDALDIVRMEKQAAKVTELAVKRFEAEVLKNKSRQFDIQQQITEAENRVNYLVGRFPQHVARNLRSFDALLPQEIRVGVPAGLLSNRPDIREAEQLLAASKLDVRAARANFYPHVRITGGVGLNAFNATYLVTSPQSLIYSAAGELVAPLINRNSIKAAYYTANARQLQSVYRYEQTVLSAYIEVANQLSNISNLQRSYDLQQQQVLALTESINISTRLFRSARADYMEVLFTQRDALESRFEMIDTRRQQMNAVVAVYRALGGGWR